MGVLSHARSIPPGSLRPPLCPTPQFGGVWRGPLGEGGGLEGAASTRKQRAGGGGTQLGAQRPSSPGQVL
eukprot:5554651-Alexandrium_andersonii.AAC.1